MAPEQFGNWFFGAAAAQVGLSEQEALWVGAVVQQWQDFDTSKLSLHSTAEFASELYHAITTGQGDNPGDPEQIIGGHSYSTDVYNNDPDSDNFENSCDEESSNNSTSGGSSEPFDSLEYDAGWSSGMFYGVPVCYYGSCGSVSVFPGDMDLNINLN